jgi:hypothetical protein
LRKIKSSVFSGANPPITFLLPVIEVHSPRITGTGDKGEKWKMESSGSPEKSYGQVHVTRRNGIMELRKIKELRKE